MKLLDTMCKYEMDLASIVEETERTRFKRLMVWQTDGQMDRGTNGKGETSIPPPLHNCVKEDGMVVVYAASCCSHEPCHNETLNIVH